MQKKILRFWSGLYFEIGFCSKVINATRSKKGMGAQGVAENLIIRKGGIHGFSTLSK